MTPPWYLSGSLAEPWFGPAPAAPLVTPPQPLPAEVKPAPEDRPQAEPRPRPQRGSNPPSVALARRLIGVGDDAFRRKNYAQAYQQYRNAARTSPALAEARFREGFVLIAMGNYEAAGRSIQRAMELDPGWAQSGFHLEQLYGDNQAEKLAHLNALAAAAARELDRGELLQLVGVFLYFDGQEARSMPFFQRAMQLGGVDPALVKDIVKP